MEYIIISEAYKLEKSNNYSAYRMLIKGVDTAKEAKEKFREMTKFTGKIWATKR